MSGPGHPVKVLCQWQRAVGCVRPRSDSRSDGAGQGYARCARRLTPPLTGTAAAAGQRLGRPRKNPRPHFPALAHHRFQPPAAVLCRSQPIMFSRASPKLSSKVARISCRGRCTVAGIEHGLAP